MIPFLIPTHISTYVHTYNLGIYGRPAYLHSIYSIVEYILFSTPLRPGQRVTVSQGKGGTKYLEAPNYLILLCVCLSIYLSVYIHLFISRHSLDSHLANYPPTYLFIYLSIYGT